MESCIEGWKELNGSPPPPTWEELLEKKADERRKSESGGGSGGGGLVRGSLGQLRKRGEERNPYVDPHLRLMERLWDSFIPDNIYVHTCPKG